MKQTLKIGDSVKVIDKSEQFFNKIGIVLDFNIKSFFEITVKFDNVAIDKDFFHPNQLQLIKPKKEDLKNPVCPKCGYALETDDLKKICELIKPKTKKVKKWKYSRNFVVRYISALERKKIIDKDTANRLRDLLATQPQPIKEESKWVGKFAPNGGHDPNNPFPLKQEDKPSGGIRCISKKIDFSKIKTSSSCGGSEPCNSGCSSHLKQEDNKECKHEWHDAFASNNYYCSKCGKESTTPSPLDEIEEIEEMDWVGGVDHDDYLRVFNKLIRNQNKLISLTKRNIK